MKGQVRREPSGHGLREAKVEAVERGRLHSFL